MMEQSPGRYGTPAPGCPASLGCGTLVSAGILGWEHEKGARDGAPVPRSVPEESHVSPATSSSLVPQPAPSTQHPGLCLPPGDPDLGQAVPTPPTPSPIPSHD